MTENEPFNSLYRRTKPSLMRYVSRRVVGDASEIVDEIYLTAWRKRTDIPGDEENQLMWLYAIGRRTIANTVRWHARRDRFNRSTNPLATTSVSNESSETTILVHDCLSRLNKNDREILLLIEWDDCSTNEAAGILNITEAAATKRLKHARDSFIELYSAKSLAS
jgi:RNA polymerase sigma factor (sigma-70 family)